MFNTLLDMLQHSRPVDYFLNSPDTTSNAMMLHLLEQSCPPGFESDCMVVPKDDVLVDGKFTPEWPNELNCLLQPTRFFLASPGGLLR